MARFPPTGGPLRVLELGCGVGRDSRVLATSHEVWAVDHSSVAIARARRAARGIPRLRFEVRDALDAVTRREDTSIDVVYAHALYMGFQERELDELLGGIRRVLRPRGLHFFAVRSTTDPHYGQGTEIAPDVWYGGPHETPMHYYRRESLERLSRTGFERVEETLREDLYLWFVCDQRP